MPSVTVFGFPQEGVRSTYHSYSHTSYTKMQAVPQILSRLRVQGHPADLVPTSVARKKRQVVRPSSLSLPGGVAERASLLVPSKVATKTCVTSPTKELVDGMGRKYSVE